MRVIGTAGHVDHGKSALVEALTGVHPDRLKEERERQMSIDLGFAWVNLPLGPDGQEEEVGIVDVPGHRDFIENMLAGIGGIDAALFVIAADEGIMPQTREHLAILDLLEVQGGVVAITKIDLIDDPEWLDLVETDISETLAGTVLEESPIVRVSARSGAGLDALRTALQTALISRPPRHDLGRPRLPIDRVFTIAGFGTVVTGTLDNGVLREGEEVIVLPAGARGRIRGIQTHNRKEAVALPGSRTAVNLSGISLEDVQRGDVLAKPGDYKPTRRLDVRFRLLPEASQPVKHNMEVKLFLGAAEVMARLRLLGEEELLPGERGWLQLEPRSPVVAARGDRYILRRPSPGETIGGGLVVDPHPRRRHKRFSKGLLSRLEALSGGTPEDVLLQTALALGFTAPEEILQRSNLEAEAGKEALEALLALGDLVELGSPPAGQGIIAPRSAWEQLAERMLQETQAYHSANPLRKGMPRQELRSRLSQSLRGSAITFNAAVARLASQGSLVEEGPLLRKPAHQVRFTPKQQEQVDSLLEGFAQQPFSPPTVKEAQETVGEDLYNALLDLEMLVQVSPEVVFRQADYEHMKGAVRTLLQERGEITAAEVRDHFSTSRKYALALMEHLDASGVTVRAGDIRRLRR